MKTLVTLLDAASGLDATVRYAPSRAGEVGDGLADLTAVRAARGFEPRTELREGLGVDVGWLRAEPAGVAS